MTGGSIPPRAPSRKRRRGRAVWLLTRQAARYLAHSARPARDYLFNPVTGMLAVFAAFSLAVAFDLSVRGLERFPRPPVVFVTEGEPALGREAIVHYGCGSCHVIPGVPRATARVGPRLEGFREQVYIAGMLPNTGEHLVEWIMNPKDVNPLTAMPDLDVSESDARHIAAYLYTLR